MRGTGPPRGECSGEGAGKKRSTSGSAPPSAPPPAPPPTPPAWPAERSLRSANGKPLTNGGESGMKAGGEAPEPSVAPSLSSCSLTPASSARRCTDAIVSYLPARDRARGRVRGRARVRARVRARGRAARAALWGAEAVSARVRGWSRVVIACGCVRVDVCGDRKQAVRCTARAPVRVRRAGRAARVRAARANRSRAIRARARRAHDNRFRRARVCVRHAGAPAISLWINLSAPAKCGWPESCGATIAPKERSSVSSRALAAAASAASVA
eukprot:4581479-Prymnesium_polylepis.1